MAENFSAKQQEFIIEFITNGNLKDTCKKVGIAKQTYYNWLSNPKFEKELKKQQQKHYECSLLRMRNLFIAAVETHEELLKSENESIRLRTANSIFGKNNGFLESYEHRNRLNALEKKVFEQEEIKKMEERIDELDSKVK